MPAHSSMMIKFLCGIFWSLFSFFSMFSKLRASENEEVPTFVPHYLYTQPTGFSVRKNKYIWAFGDVSAHFCISDTDSSSSEGKMVCSKPEGIREDSGWMFWKPPLVHVQNCQCVHSFEEEICSLHPLKMLLPGVRIQFFSMGQRDFFQVPNPLSAPLNGSLPKEVPRSVQKTRGLHSVSEQGGWEVAECFESPVVKL